MTLKRQLATLSLSLLLGLGASAQSSKVTNAKFAYDAAKDKLQEEDYEGAIKEIKDAIANIEPATKHEKTMGKEKTWRYRAGIYDLIARSLDKPGMADVVEDPIGMAAESYSKALELDTKGAYKEENKRGLQVVKGMAMNSGIQSYNDKDYAKAFAMFEKSAELGKSMGITDTLAFYNAGLSADRAGMNAEALDYFQKTIDLDYNQPALFIFMAEIHKEAGDEEAAIEAIKKGVAKYPSDQGLLIELVNVYLAKGEMDKALDYLQKTLAQDPNNKSLQYNVGAVYDNMGNIEEARAAYGKALEIDGEYFDANYNMGASFYNEAVELINQANQIPTSKMKEYEAAKAKADDVMKSALPFLEKAHQILPDDKSTMASLAEIYARTGDLEKRKAIMEKMQK